jgi:hypothetical protein
MMRTLRGSAVLTAAGHLGEEGRGEGVCARQLPAVGGEDELQGAGLGADAEVDAVERPLAVEGSEHRLDGLAQRRDEDGAVRRVQRPPRYGVDEAHRDAVLAHVHRQLQPVAVAFRARRRLKRRRHTQVQVWVGVERGLQSAALVLELRPLVEREEGTAGAGRVMIAAHLPMYERPPSLAIGASRSQIR